MCIKKKNISKKYFDVTFEKFEKVPLPAGIAIFINSYLYLLLIFKDIESLKMFLYLNWMYSIINNLAKTTSFFAILIKKTLSVDCLSLFFSGNTSLEGH